jgi:virginiamycin A acetyltransferase
MNLRSLVKSCFRFAAHVAISPILLVHFCKVPILGKDRALEGSSQCISLIPGILGQYLRRAFLSWTIEYCHPSASVGFGTIFSKSTARIEENVYIGPFCSFGDVHIGKDTLIATGVHVTSGSRMHGIEKLDVPIRLQPGTFTTVHIGENCWIGNGAIVMANVGRDTVVGAGSVVAKPLPNAVIAVGAPARVVKNR